jgi:hypothetical protein
MIGRQHDQLENKRHAGALKTPKVDSFISMSADLDTHFFDPS